MSQERTPRSDSATGAVAAMQEAAVVVSAPASVRLKPEHLPFFDTIVRARAPGEWSEVDLLHAANLSRTLSDIERLSDEVATEGDTVTNARGTMIANAKHGLLEILSRRAFALTKLLQIHSVARNGPTENLAKKRGAVKAARETLAHTEAEDDDDLLARPGE